MMANYSIAQVLEPTPPKRYTIDQITAGEPEPVEDPGMLRSMLIGTGRTFDKLIAGGEQLAYGAAEKLGSTSARAKLDALAEDQRQKDAIYAPLQKQRPYSTGLGEALPSVVVPVGRMASAAARIGAPAIVNAGIGAASYGSASERAWNAGTNGVTALIGGAAGEGLSRMIRPIAANSNIAPAAAEEAAKRIGFVPTAGQRSGNATLQAMEDSLAQMPGGAGVFGKLRAGNQEAINRTAAKAIGQDANALTQDVLGAAKAGIVGERQALLQGSVADPSSSLLQNAITDARHSLKGGSSTLSSGTPAKVIDEFESFLSSKNGPISGVEYQAWRTDLDQAKNAAFRAGEGKAAAAYQKLKEGLDAAFRKSSKADWTGNDQAYTAYKLLTKRPNVVNEVTGDVSGPQLTSAYLQRFGDAAKRGGVDGPIGDVAAVTRGFNAMREGSQTARREAFQGVVPWLMAPANWAAAKTLTSQPVSNWMAYGLLSENPALQNAALKGMRQAGRTVGTGIPAGFLNIEGY